MPEETSPNVKPLTSKGTIAGDTYRRSLEGEDLHGTYYNQSNSTAKVLHQLLLFCIFFTTSSTRDSWTSLTPFLSQKRILRLRYVKWLASFIILCPMMFFISLCWQPHHHVQFYQWAQTHGRRIRRLYLVQLSFIQLFRVWQSDMFVLTSRQLHIYCHSLSPNAQSCRKCQKLSTGECSATNFLVLVNWRIGL